MTNTSGYLRIGTEVKILVGNHAGNIGKIIEVIHLSFAGCIYRVASSMEVGYWQDKCQYQYLEFLLTPEQIDEYTQQEVGVK